MAPGGRVTAERMKKIAEMAEKYGQGFMHLSVRMSPEIPYVDLKDVESLAAELAEVGQRIASCGKRVRVPTACGGCEYNPNGITDTQRFARETNDRYFGMDHFHKFKISFSGCPIDCMRTREMDLGFQGQVEPELFEDECIGCTLCAEACEDDAMVMDPDRSGPLATTLPVYDPDRCISCGDCIKVCPTDALLEKRKGHAVYAGGKHGKHPHVAYPLAEFVPDDQVFTVLEKVMEWYRANGKERERIGVTIDRVGINSLRRALAEVIPQNVIRPDELAKPRWQNVFWRGVHVALPEYEAL
ncbi:MAG: 4Fe-4S dicluster domain-containing protein [Firmicutes bacterium]|nr:4Fe-4S dicluster domain-containing protein [Bacillota bacterium]